MLKEKVGATGGPGVDVVDQRLEPDAVQFNPVSDTKLAFAKRPAVGIQRRNGVP